MATVYKRASAKRDLVEDYVYLAEHAGMDVADRFLSSADESFSNVARHPGMGTAVSLRDPRLTGLRKWRVNGVREISDLLYAAHRRGFNCARLARRAGLVEGSRNSMNSRVPRPKRAGI
jgi:toxin ParE1/3/4